MTLTNPSPATYRLVPLGFLQHVDRRISRLQAMLVLQMIQAVVLAVLVVTR